MLRLRAPVVFALMLSAGALPGAQTPSDQPAARLSPERMEVFLREGKIIRERPAGKGVANTVRAALTDGTLTHDVQFQTVDQTRAVFTAGAKSEIDFRDTYRYNIAAYRLSRLLGLANVPMSVERRYKGKDAAVTWWIDDVMFDNEGREALKDGVLGPDPVRTLKQLSVMFVWDELIQNRDRNQGNFLWTTDWSLWLIDHTRAFRTDDKLLKPDRLTRSERSLQENMKQLTETSITQAMKGIIGRREIRPLLRRRDVIVAHFEKLVAERGESVVFFDR